MYVLPQQPSSIAKLLDASFRLFAEVFGRVIVIGLLLTALFLGLALTAELIFPMPADGAPPPIPPEEVWNRLALFAGLIFIYTALYMLLYGAIIHRVDCLVQQRPDSLVDALWVALRRFPAMLAGTFLYFLAGAVGTVLLIVPGIIVGLSMSLYPALVMVDGLGGYSALRTSHGLIWGQWWRTLTVYLVPSILMFVFYGIAGLIGYALMDEGETPTGIGIADVITNTFSGLLMPYFSALSYVLLHDLKLRKSGGDLARRLAG